MSTDTRSSRAASLAVSTASGSAAGPATTTGGGGGRCAQRSAQMRSSASAHSDTNASRGSSRTNRESSSSGRLATSAARCAPVIPVPASRAPWPIRPRVPCRCAPSERARPEPPHADHRTPPDPKHARARLVDRATKARVVLLLASVSQGGYGKCVPKTAGNRSTKQRIARGKGTRYAAPDMGRPPAPPRAYITRHCRFPRKLDYALRQAAKEERRRFSDLLLMIVEDWLAERAREAQQALEALAPPRRRRQARKPPREP